VRAAVSVTASEALKLHVIDVIADDVPDLLRKIDGRTVTVAGRPQRLATAGLEVAIQAPDWRTRLLAIVTDPNVAFVLLLIGVYGLMFEFLSNGAEWAHSPNRAEGRRQHDFPYRAIDRLPAARSRDCAIARTDDGTSRAAPLVARDCKRRGAHRRQAARHHRHAARGLISSQSGAEVDDMTRSRSDSLASRSTRAVRALLLTLAGLVAILGLGLVTSGGRALADDATIKIANFTFDPPTLTVKAGTTVTWVNADDIPHLVTDKDGKFHSSALDTNDKFSQTFSTAGTVEYFCAIHPKMTGKIVVTP
jgi:plastocyanin